MAFVTVVRGPVQERLPEDCTHGDLEYLGAGGPAEYYRCRTCGASIISSRGRLWRLRRPAPDGQPVG